MINKSFRRLRAGFMLSQRADAFRRLTLLLCPAVMGFVLLSGCGGVSLPADPVESSLTPTTTRETRMPDAQLTSTYTPEPISAMDVNLSRLQGMEVTFWHVWTGEEGEALQSLVEEFNNTNENSVKVDAVYVGNYNDLYDKVNAAISSGETPHLAVGFNYHILSWNAGEHVLADFNTYIRDPQWGFTEADRADFHPVFWEQDLADGVRLGLPTHRSAQVMFYNVSWARELGFELPPTTPEDFEEQSCAAARANNTDGDSGNDGTGGWVVNNLPSTMLGWLYAFGSEVVSPSFEGYSFDSPESRAAFDYLKNLYDKRCAWLIVDDFADEEFANRLALFVSASIADIPYQLAAFEEAGNADEWTVIPFPSTGEQPTVNTFGPSFALFKSSVEEELATWLFMKWFISPSIQARWIESTGFFPVRALALDELQGYANRNPHWAAGVQLLPYAHAEPHYASWRMVRWALADVGTQIFRYYFTEDRIPAMLELLDETAAELHTHIR